MPSPDTITGCCLLDGCHIMTDDALITRLHIGTIALTGVLPM
ncbi:MAG: hypothetical protein AAFV98_22055 [Chloroflexota bacterium]